MKNKAWRYYGIALLALIVDQALKLWVHFYMQPGETGQIKIFGDWFKLFYTLNPGMAFGFQFGFLYDKIVLTLIRIVATCLMVRYIWHIASKKPTSNLLLWGWALVLGGAAGNGIDSIFYGKLLGNAPTTAPFPWFYGQVIDMLYLDIWSGYLPTWIPFYTSVMFSVFPIFNIADVAILAGVSLIFFIKESDAKTLAVEQDNERDTIADEEKPDLGYQSNELNASSK